ncbi:MAG TPA: DUF72 domain-containing protein [Candidatus Limnocylindrales bacterium]|nr:DUF72 domain-containing protein [Candidatus Limnocylindrales bacterium]
MTVRIGTSGWVYNHWRGIFYPRGLHQKDWFNYYAREFNTVEINNSFYRLPSSVTFEAWREQAPLDFLYAVKASRFLTHFKRLKDPEESLQRFFDHARHLGRTLGPVLYQLPPHWQVNLPRFEYFLAALPKEYVHVVEFRDTSWLIEETFQLMERYHVAHCIHDRHPLQIPIRLTSPPVYLRFHGDPTCGGDYQPAALETWARRMDDWCNQKLDIFVYFNNDIHGYAIKNARMLKKLLTKS